MRNNILRFLADMIMSYILRAFAFSADELKGFEVKTIVGAPCLLNIIHKPRDKDGKMQAKVAGISPVPQGMAVPDLANHKITYEVEDGRSEAFNRLPEWVRKKIETCEEWISPAHVDSSDKGPEVSEDTVPF